MKKSLLLLTISVFSEVPPSFYKAKKLLYGEIYEGHNQTFYCGCEYEDKVVDLESCGYEVRKNTKRAKRTEAEHIVPAYWVANLTEKGRACWSRGTKLKGINGRKYCEKNNPEFKQAHNDLMNLVPAIGEVNGDRSNYRFSMIEGENREYGACDFEVDKDNRTGDRIVEPPQNVRGDIARVHLYMQDKYGLEFSDETFYLMKYWNEIDPISEWEQKRIRRIEEIQGELLNN
jgi:deoxyribonuclease-1